MTTFALSCRANLVVCMPQMHAGGIASSTSSAPHAAIRQDLDIKTACNRPSSHNYRDNSEQFVKAVDNDSELPVAKDRTQRCVLTCLQPSAEPCLEECRLKQECM